MTGNQRRAIEALIGFYGTFLMTFLLFVGVYRTIMVILAIVTLVRYAFLNRLAIRDEERDDAEADGRHG